ncbi:MAG: mandelate racemase/muconate lactonizing enzyme family protein [Armatimonadota bacterium]|nr:mandelate racemase/muconate lactonizing enzyme family protein [Armatimonadota bacterium]MDR7484945.1 mandelate racemase/muconate lactonizing enzyme family protein [Armatimonadota bacterium]MDR7533648.1 mandelate racemase/muconate lactonizing enzyme family protein [Armatimonadota bacterium]MDR7535459.1 mandelate racemase/muconate lactonizing enzyme family protein [Armatimonadota bacterium]
MKIASVKTYTLSAALDRPLLFGIGAFGTFTATLVEVRTDDGHVGWGEAIARKAPEVVTTAIHHLMAPLVLGRDPRDLEGLWDLLFEQLRRWGHYRGFVFEALSGIDIALHDLLARAAGVPLYKFLGGAGRTEVRCYASSVYFAPIEQMAAEAAAQAAAGHVAIKVKIGRPPALGGLRADVASVRAVREAVGPEVEIMLDANGAYDAATAVRVARQLEPLDVAWLEEPVPPDDLSGYALLRQRTTIPLACGESEFGVFGFRDLIERRAVDILQPEIARIGGFVGARRAAALAHAYNLRVAPHTGFSGGVAHLASLHLAAALPNVSTYEYFYAPNALRDIFVQPFPAPRRGMLALPASPGLGLDLNWDLIRRYEVTA